MDHLLERYEENTIVHGMGQSPPALTGVLVIGMHRSGTSLVAGALKCMGAFLGPESDLMPADHRNAKGYWEHLSLVSINERFLAILGGNWYAPPPLTRAALENPALAAVQVEAKKLIEKDFAPHPLWVGKDPRATILLPLWRPAVPNPLFVFCVRNPLDVALSLEKRDNIPLAHGIVLWHIYTLRGLLDTKPYEREMVFYEEVLRDPVAALRPVIERIDATDRLEITEVREALTRFTDNQLEHHRHSADEFLARPDILAETKRLYEALLKRDDRAIEEAVAEGEARQEMLYALTNAYGYAHRTNAAMDLANAFIHSRTYKWASYASRIIDRLRQTITRPSKPKV